MFEKIKERKRQQEEEYARQQEEKRQQLLALSEKELMVEILLKMDRMSRQLNEIDTSIWQYSN